MDINRGFSSGLWLLESWNPWCPFDYSKSVRSQLKDVWVAWAVWRQDDHPPNPAGPRTRTRRGNICNLRWEGPERIYDIDKWQLHFMLMFKKSIKSQCLELKSRRFVFQCCEHLKYIASTSKVTRGWRLSPLPSFGGLQLGKSWK